MEPHYPYRPWRGRPQFSWPDGNRVAIVITLNVESWALTKPTKERIYQGGPGILPDPLPGDIPDWPNYTWREYGQRVGFWRILDMLSRHGVRSSATLNAQVGERYPELVSAGLEAGWEFNAHGYEQGTLLTEYAYDRDAEHKVIADVVDRFTKSVGKKPLGWLSSSARFTANTPGILADLGFLYHADYLNDDQPYPFDIHGRTMVAIPYSFEVNDYMAFYRRNFTTDEWLAMLIEQFDVLSEEAADDGQGRLMNIGLHPHVIGVPFRARSIDRFLSYVRGKEGVFFPTREEIARWVLHEKAA